MYRKKDIVEAVALLPEELLTDAIVEAAAAQHKPDLIEYLPQKYRTAEIIEKIFEKTNYDWQSWNLKNIPVDCRTYNICLRAVKNRKENLLHVPVQHRTQELLQEALDNRNVLHLLPLVSEEAWTRELAYTALKHTLNSMSSCHCDYEVKQAEQAAQVILSFVPHRIRNAKFYLGMLKQNVLRADIVKKITPSKFHTRSFLLALVAADYTQIAADRYDRELFHAVLFSSKGQTWRIIHNDAYCEKLRTCMDGELADRIAAQSPHDFDLLPQSFRTSRRLLLALRNIPDGRCDNFSLTNEEDERLLTDEVCRALVRKCSKNLPKLPAEVWNEQFATYCSEHTASPQWIKQMPRHLITWQIGTKIYEQNPYLIEYLPKWMLTPERAQALCRENSRYMEDIPQHYLTEFTRYTGLPAEFYGRQVSLAELKASKAPFTYCKIGTTYIGLYTTDTYGNDTYWLLMTRAVNRYIGAEQVFAKCVGTFHRTWLEKLVADNDPLFCKPKVDASLRDVQAMGYYGVEHLRTTLGASFYRNTFMGQTIGYCIRKAGVTYHDDCIEALIPGWKKKWEMLQKDDEEIALEQRVDAVSLHRRLGYCMTGIAAFAQDYGLDMSKSYTVGELREWVRQVGYKPSLSTYRLELQQVHII